MLSHARTDMKVIKELADDDSAYRSLTASWFSHSPLKEIMKQIAKQKANLIITTYLLHTFHAADDERD